jgi:hypothetical protein
LVRAKSKPHLTDLGQLSQPPPRAGEIAAPQPAVAVEAEVGVHFPQAALAQGLADELVVECSLLVAPLALEVIADTNHTVVVEAVFRVSRPQQPLRGGEKATAEAERHAG